VSSSDYGNPLPVILRNRPALQAIPASPVIRQAASQRRIPIPRWWPPHVILRHVLRQHCYWCHNRDMDEGKL